MELFLREESMAQQTSISYVVLKDGVEYGRYSSEKEQLDTAQGLQQQYSESVIETRTDVAFRASEDPNAL